MNSDIPEGQGRVKKNDMYTYRYGHRRLVASQGSLCNATEKKNYKDVFKPEVVLFLLL